MRVLDRLTRRDRTGGAGDEGWDPPVTDDLLDDPFFMALTQELRDLGGVDVPAASRERTWALLREEIERRPAPATERASRVARPNAARRWVIGSAALVAASALALVVAFAGLGGDEADRVAGTDTETTGVTLRTDDGPGAAPGTTTATDEIGGGGSETGTTDTSTIPDASSSSTTPTTVEAPSSTLPPTTRPPSTTEPPRTTTTGRAIMTREQRESSAEGVVRFVAQQIIAGDPAGAGSALAGDARRQVVQMAGSLQNPNGFAGQVLYTDEDGGRVLVTFTDLVDDGQGGVIETARRFFMDVQFDDSGAAVVTSIVRAP